MLELLLEILFWIVRRIREVRLPDCAAILGDMQAGRRPGLDANGFVLFSHLVFGAALLRGVAFGGLILAVGSVVCHIHRGGPDGFEVTFEGHDSYVLSESFVDYSSGLPKLRDIKERLAVDPSERADDVFKDLAVCRILFYVVVTLIATSAAFFYFVRRLFTAVLPLDQTSHPRGPAQSPPAAALAPQVQGTI